MKENVQECGYRNRYVQDDPRQTAANPAPWDWFQKTTNVTSADQIQALGLGLIL